MAGAMLHGVTHFSARCGEISEPGEIRDVTQPSAQHFFMFPEVPLVTAGAVLGEIPVLQGPEVSVC